MLEELRNERLRKLSEVKEQGIDPYPARTRRTLTAYEAHKQFAALSAAGNKVFLAGRIMSFRDQGGMVFFDIEDVSGKFQVVLKKDSFKDFASTRNSLDRGDFVSVGGVLFQTKKGEESIDADEIQILTKSLLPIPTEWYGIEDVELRLRDRYLDFLMNREARELFEKKALFWNTFRESLKKEGFLEVETPVFEHVPGGADAEPFVTHHNALDTDFYLRISLELPLKKLLVGGFEKVFEIGRIFRNEGIDREHLQDYTQLEFYWAYSDYTELMRFVEKLYKRVIKKTIGGLKTQYMGQEIDWEKKWGKVDYVKAFEEKAGIDPLEASTEELLQKARALGLELERGAGKGRLIDMIFKKTVRPTLVQPVFLVNPPVDVEPLAKRTQKDERRVERFQIMAGGTELGKGFSELNDPLDQRARFEEQMKLRATGDKEAHMMNKKFVEALEYGMPPASGFGTSERLFAVIMGKPVRETVMFPLMRPKE